MYFRENWLETPLAWAGFLCFVLATGILLVRFADVGEKKGEAKDIAMFAAVVRTAFGLILMYVGFRAVANSFGAIANEHYNPWFHITSNTDRAWDMLPYAYHEFTESIIDFFSGIADFYVTGYVEAPLWAFLLVTTGIHLVILLAVLLTGAVFSFIYTHRITFESAVMHAALCLLEAGIIYLAAIWVTVFLGIYIAKAFLIIGAIIGVLFTLIFLSIITNGGRFIPIVWFSR